MQAVGVSVGEIVAAYRKGRNWSQEKLALACETHQAHISLIEANQKHPQFSTLIRISDALRLSHSERAWLLGLGGYQVEPPLADAHSVKLALSKLVPILNGCPYPAQASDDSERIWYWNPMAKIIWGPLHGVWDDQTFHTAIRGKRIVELFLNPDRFSKWKLYFEDPDRAIARSVFLFLRACRMRPNEGDIAGTLARLEKGPEFPKFCKLVESGVVDDFLEHAAYTLHHPSLGKLRLRAWRTHAAIDDRFLVTHFTPIDANTSNAIRYVSRTVSSSSSEKSGKEIEPHHRVPRRLARVQQ